MEKSKYCNTICLWIHFLNWIHWECLLCIASCRHPKWASIKQKTYSRSFEKTSAFKAFQLVVICCSHSIQTHIHYTLYPISQRKCIFLNSFVAAAYCSIETTPRKRLNGFFMWVMRRSYSPSILIAHILHLLVAIAFSTHEQMNILDSNNSTHNHKAKNAIFCMGQPEIKSFGPAANDKPIVLYHKRQRFPHWNPFEWVGNIVKHRQDKKKRTTNHWQHSQSTCQDKWF